jgi:hypothetical protein
MTLAKTAKIAKEESEDFILFRVLDSPSSLASLRLGERIFLFSLLLRKPRFNGRRCGTQFMRSQRSGAGAGNISRQTQRRQGKNSEFRKSRILVLPWRSWREIFRSPETKTAQSWDCAVEEESG